MTFVVPVKLSARFSGLQSIFAPSFWAISAISWLSVETKTSSKSPVSSDAVIGHEIIGEPEKVLMFLSFILWLPPRAGIITDLNWHSYL